MTNKVKNMNKKILAVGVISFFVIFIPIYFFIIWPMMILPPYPSSLFVISNWDDVNHTVQVEIINSNNNSIFIESFDLKPDDLFSFERILDWCSKGRFYWLSWDEGSYTFKVTLDDTYDASHYTELYPSKSVWIIINSNNPNPLEIGDVFSD